MSDLESFDASREKDQREDPALIINPLTLYFPRSSLPNRFILIDWGGGHK